MTRLRGLAIKLGVVAFIFLALGGGFWLRYFADMPRIPPTHALWSIQREPSVRLLDRNGDVIATRGPNYGEAVEYGELPTHLIFAFLATEDKNFWKHDGIDRRAILRAFLANAVAGRVEQGGSTITQQLVKNLLLTPEQTTKRKLQEIVLSLQLENRLSKPEILALYLNRIYLGGRSFGVDAAAKRYFGKSARELTLGESALIAGLPKAPSRFDPTRSLENARARAALVLANMEAEGFITPDQRADAQDELVALPEIEEPAGEQLYGYVFDYVIEEAEKLLPAGVSDLVVRTTIDPALQEKANEILNAELDGEGKEKKASQGAVVVLDRDGGIVAMLGGRSYDVSKFNRATQAKRQPGSAYKALVYAAAIESGARINAFYRDQPVTIGDWSPSNYYPGYKGEITLRTAFEQSVNTVAAQLVADVGPEAVVSLAQRFGIGREIDPLPSIALGSEWATPLEMAGVYSVFANDGKLKPPHMIARIEDTRAEALYTRPEFEPNQVYSSELAQRMNGLMRGVVTHGTGKRAAPDRIDVAGKTGTSQDWRDAWFVGFSGEYVAAVWVGNDDYTPMDEVTGGDLPAEIWRKVMTQAHTQGATGAQTAAVTQARGLNVAEERRPSTPRAAELYDFYSRLGAAFTAVERAPGQ